MTVNETGMILAKIRATFPNWKVNDPKATVAIWTELLQGETYEDINKAFIIYARQGDEFAPTPGQLLSVIKKYKPGSRSSLDILNDIKVALRNSIYGAESEFEKLPKAAQLAIGSPNELRRIGMNGLDSYQENNLIKRIEDAIDITEVRNEQLKVSQVTQLSLEYKDKR